MEPKKEIALEVVTGKTLNDLVKESKENLDLEITLIIRKFYEETGFLVEKIEMENLVLNGLGDFGEIVPTINCVLRTRQ